MLNRIFNLLGVKHPDTGIVDPLLTMTVFIVVICGIKFLFEGVVAHIGGHILDLGHADPGGYAAILTPVLGLHGWSVSKDKSGDSK